MSGGQGPSRRIAFGMLALTAGLLLYGIAVALVFPPFIAGWPALVQLPIYVALGIAWIFPTRRFLVWMEAGEREE